MAKRDTKIMKILCSNMYEQQLKDILESINFIDSKEAKSFKLYLDTIIINIPTKAKKYKQSLYSNNENVKDVEYHDYTIPFFWDKKNDNYIILGIIKKN